jgi:hypothetical protein
MTIVISAFVFPQFFYGDVAMHQHRHPHRRCRRHQFELSLSLCSVHGIAVVVAALDL